MLRDYLGDGLYGAFDGVQIELSTLEGERVYLEPAVFEAFLRFAGRCHGRRYVEEDSDGH